MCNVLIIEDDDDDAELYSRLLVRRFSVTRAATLADGLALLDAREFDAIVLDLRLSNSAGLATFERVHQQFGKTAIVVLSSGIEDELADGIMRRGAQEVLDKNRTSPEMLLFLVGHAIMRQQREAAATRLVARCLALNQKLDGNVDA